MRWYGYAAVCVLFCVIILGADWGVAATHDASNVLLNGRWGSGPCYSVAGAGNLIYAGDGAVVRVLDVSNPAAPVEVGSVTVDGYVRSLALTGNRLCVASHFDGLRIVDVSNPAAPVEVGSALTGGIAVAVAAQGDYAYVGASGDGMRIFDISNPASPFEVDQVSAGFVFAVAVEGNLAFAGDFSVGLHIIDVTDPTNASLITDIGVHGTPYGIEASGNYVYVAASGSQIAQMTVIDVTNPALPTEADRYAVLFTAGSGLGLDGNTVYFTAGVTGGVHLIDVTDPTDILLLGQVDTPAWASDATILGNYAYVADREGGVRCIDVSVPATPSEVGFFETAGKTFDVAADGEYVYLADRTEGLRVLDITNPAQPVEIGSLDTAGIPLHITLDGNLAFISDDTNGLVIIDISTPSAPTYVSTYSVGTASGHAAWECVVDGNLAYVAALGAGMHIVDISNPALPVLVEKIEPTTSVLGLDVRYPYAYLATGSPGLYIIDVTDPTTPSVVDFEDTANARDVEINANGDFAIVADGLGGLVAVNVSNPNDPFQVNSVLVPDYAREVDVEGIFAYVATEDSGLRIIDISSLPAMGEIGYYDTADEAFGVHVDGFNVFIADDDDGLWILANVLAAVSVEDLEIPSRSILQNVWPNPFNPRTTISFNLPTSGRVQLDAYDVRGARVATLLDEVRSAGNHDVVWGGRDDRGHELGSGVYMIRLETAEGSESVKAILVR